MTSSLRAKRLHLIIICSASRNSAFKSYTLQPSHLTGFKKMVDAEERMIRHKKVSELRAKWRLDKDSGLLPVRRPLDVTRDHPVYNPAEQGVPVGCVGKFVVPEGTGMEMRGNAIAHALEHASEHSGLGDISTVPTLTLAEACALGSFNSNDGSGLKGGSWFESFARRGVPCVLRESLGSWDCAAWTPAALAASFGDRPWTVRSGQNYGSMRTAETTLGAYLASWAEERSPSHFYGANNALPPELAPKLALPPVYPPHAFRLAHTRLWLGGPGAGVHCHRDIQDNFVAMLFGAKRFTLYAPHATAQLGGARPVTPYLHEAAGHQSPECEAAAAECAALKPVIVDLGPGDCLFLPGKPLTLLKIRSNNTSFSNGVTHKFSESCRHKIIPHGSPLLLSEKPNDNHK